MLEAYLAGRERAERVVEVVGAVFYGDGGRAMRERLMPLVAVIERAHPGVIELAGSTDNPGFAVRLVERPFPREYAGQLREAVEAVLAVGVTGPGTRPPSSDPRPALWSRLYTAVRRLLSGSR